MKNPVKPSLRRRSRHKQSKYFTIMLIPDSSGKVKSIKIPHWVFHCIFCVIALVLTVIVLSSTQASRFAQMFNESTNELNEAIREKEEIQERKNELEITFEEEKKGLASAFEQEKQELMGEKQSIESKINDFEKKVEELQEKINEIDALKEEIYDKIGELKDAGAPVNSELLAQAHAEDDGTNPMGGPSLPASQEDGFKGVLSEMLARLENDIEELSAINAAADDLKMFIAAYPMGWPVYGRITSNFGNRTNPFGGVSTEFHSGLDIKCSIGTQIAVTGAGKVTFSGYKNGYGYIVTVDHGYGFSTSYAHNSKLLVNVGDKVERGDIIALSGNTGRSTGPHCHYEVKLDGVLKNPVNYLEMKWN